MKTKRAKTRVALILTTITLIGGIFCFPQKTISATKQDYDYSIVYQSPYKKELAPGETTVVSIQLKNTGAKIWDSSTRIGSGSLYGGINQKKDSDSEFSSTNWVTPNRAASLSNKKVLPGQTALFQFDIKAPASKGQYKAYFTPLIEGTKWMKDIGIYWELNVKSTSNTIDAAYVTKNENKTAKDLISEFNSSTVRLICSTNKDTTAVSLGSGTLFKNSSDNTSLPPFYILTNNHVIETDDASLPQCIVKANDNSGQGYVLFYSYKIVKFDKENDIAIIEPIVITNSNDKSLAKMARSEGIAIDQYHLGSYPDLVERSIEDTNLKSIDSSAFTKTMFNIGYPDFAEGAMTVTEGEVVGNNTSLGKTKYTMTNAKVGPGMSGGLSINERGALVGIPSKALYGPKGEIIAGIILNFSDEIVDFIKS